MIVATASARSGKAARWPGVEEQGLLVVDEVLVEGEAGRADLGDEGREPVDAVGDLVDLGVHGCLLGCRWGQSGRGWRRIPVPWPRSARIRANSTASMSTRSPSVPARNIATGRTVQGEHEGLAVGGRPFGDQVGHDPAVVVPVEVEGGAGGPSQVDPVHPHVASEADVEEVGERLATDRRRQVEQGESGKRAGEPAAGSQRPSRGGVPFGDELRRTVSRPLADLELVHAVPPELAADLHLQRTSLAHLADEFPGSGLAGGGAHHMGDECVHVPEGAVGGLAPVLRPEAPQQLGELLVLPGGDPHGLVMGDPRNRPHVGCGCLAHHEPPFCSPCRRSTSATYMSTTRPARRTHRSPPGSFATC